MSTHSANAEIAALHRAAELEAERIVSLVRLVAAAGLLTFFALVVPDRDDVRHTMLIRQGYFAFLTMTAYLLLGLGGWVLIRTGRFHRWMVWPAALADALFVVVAVWSSMQNAALFGDAVFVYPSVWLIPMVLSFGVLRGDPRVMTATVVTLVVGLGLLIMIDAGGTKGISQSPIWLFLSPPPNVMRLILIAIGGAILIYAARRTRRLLSESIEATVRTANLTRYLPAKFAPDLAAGRLDELRRGQREEVAVLFVDIRGFTRLSEGMLPREVSDFVTDFRRRVARVVDAHDGVIDKFMGDAAMVLFTEPEDPARAAANGLACATHLNRAMQHWSVERVAAGQPPIRVGIGLHFGVVFSGVVGDENRLEYSVFGDTVNVAARLEEMTKELPSPVLASREVVAAAGKSCAPGDWSCIAHTVLRGRDGDMDIMAPVAAGGSDTEQRLQ